MQSAPKLQYALRLSKPKGQSCQEFLDNFARTCVHHAANGNITWVVYQLELGKIQKQFHIQFSCEFTIKCNDPKKIFGDRCFVVNKDYDIVALMKYPTKKDTRVNGPFLVTANDDNKLILRYLERPTAGVTLHEHSQLRVFQISTNIEVIWVLHRIQFHTLSQTMQRSSVIVVE